MAVIFLAHKGLECKHLRISLKFKFNLKLCHFRKGSFVPLLILQFLRNECYKYKATH